MLEAYRSSSASSYAERCHQLDTLLALVRDNQTAFADAVNRDFGMRSAHETRIAEIFSLCETIKYVRARLRSWMRPKRRGVPLVFRPGRAHVAYQPLGVVGVISPWNYPLQLALGPAAYALAAGNRVLIKPSEHTSETAALLERLVAERFDATVLRVVTGGTEVGEAFSRLPFDHLLFTGSTQVGRAVMQAAAQHLTPVTLELGGKSPAIVHGSYPTAHAAARIAWGKWFNAGQTCIAPDYALVHEAQRDAFVASVAAHVRDAYPTIRDNPDYTSVVGPRHYRRLHALLADAQERGARAMRLCPESEALSDESHRMPPTLLLDVSDAMQVMQEEIFGPILPVVTYRALDEAIAYVNARPRPLALYYFDEDREHADTMLARTSSGAAVLNDVMLHFAIDDLPFGGVGASGMGAYHGIEGFETFSHKKAVFVQSRLNFAGLLRPPYGKRVDALLRLLIR